MNLGLIQILEDWVCGMRSGAEDVSEKLHFGQQPKPLSSRASASGGALCKHVGFEIICPRQVVVRYHKKYTDLESGPAKSELSV